MGFSLKEPLIRLLFQMLTTLQTCYKFLLLTAKSIFKILSEICLDDDRKRGQVSGRVLTRNQNSHRTENLKLITLNRPDLDLKLMEVRTFILFALATAILVG